MGEITTNLARGILELGMAPPMPYQGKDLKIIGIFSKTREEWLLTDIAAWKISVTSVPLYDTLGEETMKWVFTQTEIKAIFLSAPGITKLISLKASGSIPSLSLMISYDKDVPAETIEKAAKVGIKVLFFQDVIEAGRNSKRSMTPCTPDDLLTICYTSGTTAKGKGVELTHRNLLSDAAGIKICRPYPHAIDPGSSMVSYLPMAHVFERIMQYLYLSEGFKVGFYAGDQNRLMEDVAVVRPFVFVAVPRVFSRINEKIMESVKRLTGLKKTLFEKAVSSKLASFEATGNVNNWFYDNFVLNKVSAILGGRVINLISSAAPLDPKLMNLFRVLFSTTFIQGYGLTETAGAISMGKPTDFYPGSLGAPLVCNEVKVQDVPEMNYYSTDMENGVAIPRGELLVRGKNVMRGYFKDPEKTKEVLDVDGWFHTGDIACMLPEGAVKVIDRKKNIFKLQQGEYVAPEKLENVLVACEFVTQIFIYGDSFKSYLIAVIVPRKDTVLAWAEKNKLKADYEALCLSEELKSEVVKSLGALAKKENVLTYINVIVFRV